MSQTHFRSVNQTRVVTTTSSRDQPQATKSPEVQMDPAPDLGAGSDVKEERKHRSSPKQYAEISFGALHTDAEILKSVSEISQRLAAKKAAVYQKAEEPKVPSFYINTKSNAVTLVGDKEHHLVSDEPYNIVVAAFTGLQPTIKTGLFEVPASAFVSEAAKASATKFATYCHKVRTGELELNESSSEEKNLLKYINRSVANRAWLHFAKIDNLLSPPESEKEINDQLARLKGKRRERGASRLDVTYRRKLLRETERWFVADYQAYAHALVHGLMTVADLSIGANDKIWKKILSDNKFLRPSVKDLERVGVYPSVGLMDFKNLFTPLEWGEIESCGLLVTEKRCKELRNRKLDFDSLIETFRKSTEIKKNLAEDPFYENLLAIKGQRLALCGNWKRDQKRDQSLNMWRKVGENFLDSTRTREAFGIGRIAILKEKLVAVSYQALNSLIIWDDESETYVIRDVNSPDLKSSVALSYVTEFIGLING